MPLLDDLQRELGRAGRAAREALGEGKGRLDLFRARREADAAAQALGYAVHRAREAAAKAAVHHATGLPNAERAEPDAGIIARLDSALLQAMQEVDRVEAALRRVRDAGTTAAGSDTAP